MLWRTVLLAAAGLCWSLVVQAQPVVGSGEGEVQQVRVFRVFDGDRLLVRSRYHSARVQLAGIDAPELDQPGGLRSRQILEKMVLGKRVLMQPLGTNTVGEALVRVRWHEYDISLELLRAGAAWAGPDATPALRDAERSARDQRLGIWADDQPAAVPPWQWRAEHPQDN